LSEVIYRTVVLETPRGMRGYEHLIALSKKLHSLVSPYVEEVLENPDRVLSVASRLLFNPDYLLNWSLLSMALLDFYSKNPGEFAELVKQYLAEVRERFARHGVDVSEALDEIAYHDLWKMKVIAESREEYFRKTLEFCVEYFDEALNYVTTLVSIELLLLASHKVTEKAVLEKIAVKLRELAEELGSYTTSFELMLTPASEEDREVVRVYDSVESIRREWERELEAPNSGD